LRAPKLHHAAVAFGLIVGEGNRRIVKEAQSILFARCEAQEEIVSGSARRTVRLDRKDATLFLWMLPLGHCSPVELDSWQSKEAN
jgi:hypothetical protein